MERAGGSSGVRFTSRAAAAGRDARGWARSQRATSRAIWAASGERIADLPIDTSLLREA